MATAQAIALSSERITAEELCARYAAKVSRFAALTASSRDEAEDIAQDALLKAVRALDRYDPSRASLDGWLWRIVANTARDATRRERVRAAVVERLGLDHPRSASVEDEAIAHLSTAEVLSAVRRLGPRDRELLALRFGSGLDTAEVGEVMGLSAETARRAIGRALERARATVERSRR